MSFGDQLSQDLLDRFYQIFTKLSVFGHRLMICPSFFGQGQLPWQPIWG